ncbi:OmpA family protein [Algoriphagus confluentis]|uniref:OmpA-like domain-containing protein n=1 Tax=Algoriphagus confluentis TaxID=1697556 RepID=A0ABQ6PNX0_9BACT|nr:hypothetical protein Aconfl_11500 [Algoriphagus confluentis]
MKKSYINLLKASSLVCLAFCFYFPIQAQDIRSLSGANSPNDDSNPVWIGDNTLLFTRAFHPQNVGGVQDPGDIWMTIKKATGEWDEAVHRPDLSTAGYDLALGLEDYLTLLVLRTESGRNSIHQYTKFGKDWNYLREVNFPFLAQLSGPITGRVASGGNLLFLSGNTSSGFGNEDLYLSRKTGPVQWSDFVSLGPQVNGKGQEVSPYFDPVTGRLYFSSNSHPGASGKDILISKKMGDSWDSWSIPVKWEQISSKGSDISVTFLEGEEVVWSSTLSSDGYADLLTFSVPVPLLIPEEFPAPVEAATIRNEERKDAVGKVSDSSLVAITSSETPKKTEAEDGENTTNEVKKAEVPLEWTVLDNKTKFPLEFQLEGQKGTNLEILDPTLLLSELVNDKITGLKISAKGYFPKYLGINELPENGRILVTLIKAEAGSIVLLDKVNFKRGTSELEEGETEIILADLAVFLVENPEIVLRINGHTDNVGDPGLNKQLSLERAGSVRDFLVSKGVEFENLRISGWGGTRPIASNVTEAGRAKNRRVELVVEK